MNDYEDALKGWLSQGKPAEADDGGDLFSGRNAALTEALARVKDWVRVRFSLPEDAAILVSEVACNLPGCPPLETAVAFWTKDGGQEVRHHFKMFKRAQEVAFDDLPYAWMRDELIVPEGFDCECC
jgi:nitrate reductase delta subunit